MNMKKVKEFAEQQWYKYGESGEVDGMIGFVYNDMFVINPFIDESGRFELSDEEAIEYYGIENIKKFAEMI